MRKYSKSEIDWMEEARKNALNTGFSLLEALELSIRREQLKREREESDPFADVTEGYGASYETLV